jgi:hypothetical protein
MPFGNNLLLNKQWRFGYVLLLSVCWRFGDTQLLSVRWQFGNNLLHNIHWQFWETSYCLNRNDRVSSFYKTRGSKLCFLTCFSYFSRYFHIIEFLLNCYLLISLHLSRLYGNPISCPVSRTLGTPTWYAVHAPPCFSHRTNGFLKARHSLGTW